MERQKKLNAKILGLTMKISERHPELSKYIEEMTVSIPNENAPRITRRNLAAYYDALDSMLNGYLADRALPGKGT